MKTKISFADAASELESLCETIDNLDDIGPLISRLFEEKKESLADSVDRRLRYRYFLESQIAKAEEIELAWNSRKETLQRIRNHLNNHTLMTMKANPGLKFNGALGGFRIQKSPPKLILEESKIAKEYIIEETVTKPDRVAIFSLLKSGIPVEGAHLEQGEHIRITKEISNEN